MQNGEQKCGYFRFQVSEKVKTFDFRAKKSKTILFSIPISPAPFSLDKAVNFWRKSSASFLESWAFLSAWHKDNCKSKKRSF